MFLINFISYENLKKNFKNKVLNIKNKTLKTKGLNTKKNKEFKVQKLNSFYQYVAIFILLLLFAFIISAIIINVTKKNFWKKNDPKKKEVSKKKYIIHKRYNYNKYNKKIINFHCHNYCLSQFLSEIKGIIINYMQKKFNKQYKFLTLEEFKEKQKAAKNHQDPFYQNNIPFDISESDQNNKTLFIKRDGQYKISLYRFYEFFYFCINCNKQHQIVKNTLTFFVNSSIKKKTYDIEFYIDDKNKYRLEDIDIFTLYQR